jgi:hypothetical protein
MFTIIKNRLNGGRTCPVIDKIGCDVNCFGEWNEWSNCDANIGKKSRTFKIIKPKINNGSCPEPEIMGCRDSIIVTTPIISNMINVTSSGDKYIIFNYTSDNAGLTGQTEYTFTVSNYDLTEAMILIVGGGGGGGSHIAGGGGGGDVSENNITIPIGTHKIRVGRGGSGSTNENITGGSGFNSELILQSGTIYRYCGGGGGGSSKSHGTPGLSYALTMSSGGGGGAGGNRIAHTDYHNGGSGNGFSGNGGRGGQWYYMTKNVNVTGGTAGGGGATGNGGNGSRNYYATDPDICNGNGGTGVISNITGTNVGYGGGGGGGGGTGCVAGSGVDGGGGGGSGITPNWVNGAYHFGYRVSSGINGTGGGGGGGGKSNNIDKGVGGNGGHGVIIIKYNYMVQ